MKINNIIYLFMLLWSIQACTPEENTLVDFSGFEIVKVELGADHRQLIADGISELTLNPMLYQQYAFTTEEGGDSVVYGKIPLDRIAAGTIRYFLEDGTEIEGPKYRTTDLSKSQIGFYIVAGGLKSDVFKVTVRAPFPQNYYDTIVYPVVFHLVQEKSKVELGQGIGNDIIKYALSTINNCFSRIATFSPNGADTRVRFRLAEYDPKGKKMTEPGINRYPMSSDAIGGLSNNALIHNADICWDYHRYLNVWIVDDWSQNASAPHYILETADLNQIQGCDFIVLSESEAEQQEYVLQDIGLTFDATDFATEDVNYATQFGKYFGLLETADQQEDYCDDTFAYQIYQEPWNKPTPGTPSGSNSNSRLKISTDGLIFYSVNIMDESSYCNTISMDQVKRIRTVAEYCPHRWSYKSQWAFTGKN